MSLVVFRWKISYDQLATLSNPQTEYKQLTVVVDLLQQ